MPRLRNRGELNDWMLALHRIVWDCLICVNNYRQLEEPNGSHVGLGKSQYGRHLKYVYWFVAVTQLAKVFGDRSNDRLSFLKLFDELVSGGWVYEHDASKARRLRLTGTWRTTAEMKQAIEELRKYTRNLSPQIEMISLWRDKATAHTDPERPEGDTPQVEKLEELAFGAEEIFSRISRGLNGYGGSFHLVHLTIS